MQILHCFEFLPSELAEQNSKSCKICISQHEALECNHSNPLWRSHKRPRTRLWVTRNTGPKSCRGGIDSKWNVPWCSAGIGSLPYLSLEALVYQGWHCKCPIIWYSYTDHLSSQVTLQYVLYNKSKNWTSACYLNMLFTWMFVHFGAVLVYV